MKQLTNEMKIYLAHPWKFNPTLSFENAVRWTSYLRQRGLYILSPILITHPYWEELMKRIETIKFVQTENWLDWDLQLFRGMMNNDGQKAYTTFECEYGHVYNKPPPNKDLICQDCSFGLKEINGIGYFHGNTLTPVRHSKKYDTGICMFLSETALKRMHRHKDTFKIYRGGRHWHDIWTSEGCRIEVEFALDHNIQIFPLEKVLAFLEKFKKININQLLPLIQELAFN